MRLVWERLDMVQLNQAAFLTRLLQVSHVVGCHHTAATSFWEIIPLEKSCQGMMPAKVPLRYPSRRYA